MRVGFDTSPLTEERLYPPGIRRITRELVEALEARGTLEVVRLAPPGGSDLRKWRHTQLHHEVGRQDLAGIHSFVSAYPRKGRGLRVQTVHELPWKHGVEENADLKHRYWAGWGSRRADAIVTATEFVARDLRSNFGVRSDRVHVCPWGVSERFEEEPPPSVVDELVIARYTKSEDAVGFCPGAVRAKKNLEAVLHGLAKLRERKGPRLQLLISGSETSDLRKSLGLASKLGLSRWVSTPGEIPDEDLPSIYRASAVVPFLSRSEGFGLPVLEALACGTPVVVPRDSSQAEVAGTHGFEVDPNDPDQVADALERAIREREDLRYELPDRGRELSWSRCAEQIERLWTGLAR